VLGLREIISTFAKEMHDGLTQRFPNCDLLQALDVLNPERIKRLGLLPGDLANYGDTEIEVLIEHFGKEHEVELEDGEPYTTPALIDPEDSRREWQRLRPRLIREQGKSLADFWYVLLLPAAVGESPPFPNMVLLACVLLVVFMNSACCERGFSTQNYIKGKLRNRLSVQLLDCLMRVIELGPGLENQAFVSDLIQDAYEIWVSRKKRNPFKGNEGVQRKVRKKIGKRMRVSDYLEHLGDPSSDDGSEHGASGEDSGDDSDASEILECSSSDFVDPNSGQGTDANDGAASEDGVGDADGLGLPTVTYKPPRGWEIAQKPIVVTPKVVVKSKVAHKEGDGWRVGIVKSKIYQGESKGNYKVHYTNLSLVGSPPLKLDDYGPNKWWVMLTKK
jgi:hypothetical protein